MDGIKGGRGETGRKGERGEPGMPVSFGLIQRNLSIPQSR